VSKQKWLLILVLGILAVLVAARTSPPACQIVEVEPYEVRRAKPYIEKIVVDDAELKQLAAGLVEGYSDNEGKVNAIYRYIVENFTYIADPEHEEYIQSPFETLSVKGGDCEDLAILACSLLENLGIRTYLVLTEDHAYALVSGINPDHLWNYINKSLQEQFIEEYGMISSREETFQLSGGYAYYYGGDGRAFPIQVATFGDSVVKIESLQIDYSVSSSQPLNIYILPSKDEFDKLVRRKPFQHYPDCQRQGTYQVEATCEIPRYGGIAVQNPTLRNAVVSMALTFSYKIYFEGLKITYYTLKGEQAIVLELTAGRYGYPGYSPIAETERKVAIDPVTKQYFYPG
jgi:hypothetical protein